MPAAAIAQIIVGGELRVFGGKTYCAFGSYSVDDAKKTFTTRHRRLFAGQVQRHGADTVRSSR